MPTRTADDLRRALKSIFEAVSTPPDTRGTSGRYPCGSKLSAHDSHGFNIFRTSGSTPIGRQRKLPIGTLRTLASPTYDVGYMSSREIEWLISA